MGNKTSVQLFNDFIENERNMDDIIRQLLSNTKDFKFYEETKLVGSLNSLDYKNAVVCTHENFLRNVYGCPKHTYLIGVLNDLINSPEISDKREFIILEVMDSTLNPNQMEMNLTQFEIFKKVLSEIDPYTLNELSWKALNCKIIGTFYTDKKDPNNFTYSYDNSNLFAPISYKIFKPTKELLNIILNNHFIKNENGIVQTTIGYYRPTENQSYLEDRPTEKTNVYIDLKDVMGKRTALFGKTRLGKSNTVKLLIRTMIENKMEAGQIIFDINGEYANDNEQDGGISIASLFKDKVSLYAIKPREGVSAKVLKINFYELPDKGMAILKDMLKKDGATSQNAMGFYSVELPSRNKFNELYTEFKNLKDKPNLEREYHQKKEEYEILRNKQLMYNAILFKAGFAPPKNQKTMKFMFPKEVFEAYGSVRKDKNVWDIQDLLVEMSLLATFINKQKYQNSSANLWINDNPEPYFDAEHLALLEFFLPYNNAGGTKILAKYKELHSNEVLDFMTNILSDIENNKTIILDLGNTDEFLRQYFSDLLCAGIFQYQENLFTQNKLKNYVQLYFEEAHNIFPRDKGSVRDIYSKIAKEGAKFRIGIVYSTQSPSTVSGELLAQTENFFIGHISSRDEVNSLIKIESHFENHSEEICAIKTKGYMRVYTASHRYVIPVQIKLFNEED